MSNSQLQPIAKFAYDDNYPTCEETYSTLRIFSDEVNPNEITTVLEIASTKSFDKGEAFSKGRLRRKAHGWFYRTKELTRSRDTRRHIDLILATLDSKSEAVKALHAKGCQMDIMSYWVGVGQGGPALWPHQMLQLGNLGIEIWWDVYFSEGTV